MPDTELTATTDLSKWKMLSAEEIRKKFFETVENDGCSSIHVSISEPEYTYTRPPEYEPIQELTFRQKLALEWIIFKAWVKRVMGLDRD